MKITVLTLFPEMFENFLNTSIVGRLGISNTRNSFSYFMPIRLLRKFSDLIV